MDLHTKKIIGYSFDRTITTNFITKALENAHHTQKPAEGLIFHSDLGAQYTSVEFTSVINAFNMIQSFSATLKKEEVNHAQ